jgi:hypothetical protein
MMNSWLIIHYQNPARAQSRQAYAERGFAS